MKVLFKDELFDGQLLRALNYTYYGGSDVGECITTAQRITEPSADSWYNEWWHTAERVYESGARSLAAGHLTSAREAFLRASSYYRIAYLFLIGKPVDPRLVKAFDRQTAVFREAAALFSPPFETVAIPYEKTTLQGYFFQAADGGKPRPTLILIGGYDGTSEEAYFFNAAAALRRGYNCLAFDGPGQGAALIKQGLVFRPDWENVVRPVVDYTLSRPDVDPKRVAIMGLSFGGYLAPRAASGEHRLAACIADPGEYDMFAAVKDRMPPFLARQLPNGNPILLAVLALIFKRMLSNTTKGWGLRRGMWTHGASTPLAYVRLTRDYSMKGYAGKIKCPTLVCYADHDEIARPGATVI